MPAPPKKRPTKKTPKKGVSISIKKAVKKAKEPRGPVWKGPEVDGITQSMLSRFLVCKERFRLLVIEGWKANEGFSPRMEYGQMWHVCEEALAADDGAGYSNHSWTTALLEYAQYLCQEYPSEQNQIDKWYNVCKKQFPVYVEFWSKHADVKKRTPLIQEGVFCIPYKLPSNRVVKLRGKWDSVDLVGKGNKSGIWLQENKTKGDIDEQSLRRQLTFDLQTMIYLIALKEYQKYLNEGRLLGKKYEFAPDVVKSLLERPIKGVRYNVIRRPLSGGKGSIRQKKGSKNIPAETKEEYYARLQTYFTGEATKGQPDSLGPEYWFMRWNVDITDQDVARFKKDFLDPCLEHLCLWYNWVADAGLCRTHLMDFLHYRLPYGIYNNVAEGRGGDLEEYLLSGSTVGLKRVDKLFTELG